MTTFPFRHRRRETLMGLACLGLTPAVLAVKALDERQPLPDRVSPARADALRLPAPAEVHVGGWLGRRMDVSAQRRLLHLDMQPLLEGFIRKPGSHPWIGEHVGKWLHAATLAWAQQGDAALRRKLDRVAQDLMAAQESDGYLGTYLPGQRFGLFEGADWDVWSHKYCIIGLLAYHRHTGNGPALQAARRAADLLIATFPAKRSILAAGAHKGLAATSVLEPVVELYRLTADERYLRFAHYIVASWDEANGPALVKTLLREKQVSRVQPPKAYEMLSNLVGLAELARITGNRSHIEVCLIAWRDIVDNRLFISGGTSQNEHFQADHDLRDNGHAHVSETCVTTTWIQFNLVLLQMTGESRFAQEIERATYNHLTAAQHPAGEDWCYFTPLRGRKHYLQHPEITCCQSSGPRGLALVPHWAYMTSHLGEDDLLVVNTFETSRVAIILDGQRAVIDMESGFPRNSECRLRMHLTRPARFALRFRWPDWAREFRLAGAEIRDGWVTLPARIWRDGDEVSPAYSLGTTLVRGSHGNAGKAALGWGPFVLALDEQANPDLPATYQLTWPAQEVRVFSPVDRPPLRFKALVGMRHRGAEILAPATLLTYADAGAQGGSIRVWLGEQGGGTRPPADSLLLGGVESRSRGLGPMGKGHSFNDDDSETWVSTFDGGHPASDWFAITLERPAKAQRFVFVAGAVSDDGGWFDATSGKPVMQIKTDFAAEWRTIGILADYPQATATDPQNVGNQWDQTEYTLRTETPVSFVAVRVIGQPAGGKNPTRPYVTCAALQAFDV